MSKVTIGRGPWIESAFYGVVVFLFCVIFIPIITGMLVVIALCAPFFGIAGMLRLEGTEKKTASQFIIRLPDADYFGGRDPVTGFIKSVPRKDAIRFSKDTVQKKADELGGIIEALRQLMRGEE